VLPDSIEPISATEVLWGGRKLIYFGGCDYLRLSHDPRLIKAVKDGASEQGINAAASRKTTGNRPVYARAELAIAEYFRAERAVLVSSGYLTNLTVAQALSGDVTRVFIDERSHASLQDALALLGAEVIRFQHLDTDDLKRKIGKQFPVRNAVLVSDGMFAHNGNLAPLRKYRQLIGPRTVMWIDDSHAAGVLGKNGRGTPELFGLSRTNLIQTITFSKGFGMYGGAILASQLVAENIFSKSRIASGNTPLPPMFAAAILTALKLANIAKRDRLRQNLLFLFAIMGKPAPKNPTPIIPILPRSKTEADRIKSALLEANIYPCCIRYPGGPNEGYFRFAISAGHSKSQLKKLASVISPSA